MISTITTTRYSYRLVVEATTSHYFSHIVFSVSTLSSPRRNTTPTALRRFSCSNIGVEMSFSTGQMPVLKLNRWSSSSNPGRQARRRFPSPVLKGTPVLSPVLISCITSVFVFDF
ncbi:hypothetical protein L1887_03440 [Cichorium endivia]|nr:hypothetical protein L1887_03440 [Cichorium endivia]